MTDHCSFRRWAHHAITGTIIGSLDATAELSSCSLTVDFAHVSLVGYSGRPRGSHAPAYGFIARLVFISKLHFAVERSASFCRSHFLAAKDHLAMVIGSTIVEQGDLRRQEPSGGCCRAIHASLLRHTSATAVLDTSILSD